MDIRFFFVYGVSVTIGTLLRKTLSVAELAAHAVSPDEIRALRTEAGRPINKVAVASLLGVRDGSTELAVSLLSGLRGITPPVSGRPAGFSALCTYPGLASVQIAQSAPRGCSTTRNRRKGRGFSVGVLPNIFGARQRGLFRRRAVGCAV